MDTPRQIVAVIAATAALAGFAAGCGEGENSERESAQAPASPTAPIDRSDPPSDEAAPESDRPDGSESGSEEGAEGAEGTVPPAAEAAAERDSGGGAEQFRVPNGDNSIQSFGEEASTDERHTAALVLHAFLQARANEQWDAVCSYLSTSVTDQLRQLAPQAEGAQGGSCEETLGAISPPLSGAAKAEFTAADVGSLRVEDERAFILYRGAGNTIYALAMMNESGEWKAAALAPVALS